MKNRVNYFFTVVGFAILSNSSIYRSHCIFPLRMLFKSKQFILDLFSKFGYGFCRDLRKSFWKSSIFKIKVINLEQLKHHHLIHECHAASFRGNLRAVFFPRKKTSIAINSHIQRFYYGRISSGWYSSIYKSVSKIAGNESGLTAVKGFVELKEFYWMWFN